MMDGGSGGNTRSAIDKERTKMRERQRRSITTKIFHGLRKHGGYHLSPRSDINEVLRELAKEAGWIVDPDGTTYRSTTAINSGSNVCSFCGNGRGSGTPTPISSVIGGGECSTTTSPRRVAIGDSAAMGFGGTTSLYYYGGLESAMSMHTYGGLAGGNNHSSAGGGPPSAVALAYHHHQQQQQLYLKEARASNQNTPVGSPCRRS